MTRNRVLLVTGTRKGIGKFLAQRYVSKGWRVIGCSRKVPDWEMKGYRHFCADVSNEIEVKELIKSIRKEEGSLDALINNAGIASMNHVMLTKLSTVKKIFETNVYGTFLLCREGAKLMSRSKSSGRIINFTTIASPLRLEGEAIYASSKSAVETLTQILARELADLSIRVNAIGPTPVPTDLMKNIPEDKIEALLGRQAIKRWGTMTDVANVIDFYLMPESEFITGQILYLGGINN